MPKIPQKISENVSDNASTMHLPDTSISKLRPFTFHGVHLVSHDNQAVGDCPFCESAKFYVSVETGLYDCKVCGNSGNPLTFIRRLWELSSLDDVIQVDNLIAERGFLGPETLAAWGVRQSLIDGKILIPGYDITGRMDQIYRRTRILDNGVWSWRLLPTPGLWSEGKVHAIHTSGIDASKELVDIFEGPYDGMAYWETVDEPVRVRTNIIAVPGCNVFREDWLPLFRGKDVALWFDSDYKVLNGKTIRAGFNGMYRIARMLNGVARSVRWLRWGKEGYDPTKPSGWDVRDHLTQATDRQAALAELIGKLEIAPADWFSPTSSLNGTVSHSSGRPEPVSCNNWKIVESALSDALEWRQEMSDVTSVLFAVCASTQQAGNQLFLQLVGDAGSAKTSLCEGLLVSSHCYELENLKNFFSGWRKPGDGDKDCSIIARINGRTLITCEADTLIASPYYQQLMSQQRRIFDGKTTVVHGNSDEDRRYEGLRTPWIMAGTPSIMDVDQSKLGDRFMRVILNSPDEKMANAILGRAFDSEMSAVLETANGTTASLIDKWLRKAHGLMGGYVDWLRAYVTELLPTLIVSKDAKVKIMELAELTADLRARPNFDIRKQEVNAAKELPTRITRQLARMALCLSVTLNKREVDVEVMRIVRKIALDTSVGCSLNIVKWLCSNNPQTGLYNQDTGMMLETLSTWSGMNEAKMSDYLRFLRKIGVLNHVPIPQSRGVWKLTDRVHKLYTNVMRSE